MSNRKAIKKCLKLLVCVHLADRVVKQVAFIISRKPQRIVLCYIAMLIQINFILLLVNSIDIDKVGQG